jgi:polyisoprenoid-binding protein YceI
MKERDMKRLMFPIAIFLLVQGATAQTPPVANKPTGASKDPAAAPSGIYHLDPRHASIIARIGHGGGTSLSTFRFGTASGSLEWNGANPVASKMSVTVDMTSLQTPVPDFASELIGDRFLKTRQFHDATFRATKIERSGPTSGRITGDLTFMGQMKPIVIDAKLMGSSAGRNGPVIGFSGSTHFSRSDFGFSSMAGPIGDQVELLLDVEFDKTA